MTHLCPLNPSGVSAMCYTPVAFFVGTVRIDWEVTMKLGIVGLGKMGASMALRMMRGGHDLVVTDLSAEAMEAMVREGATSAPNLAALVAQLEAPRVVWLMVPAGAPTESLVQDALAYLETGDTIVDGANSNWEDSKRRATQAQEQGVNFVDVGVSGGVWGLEMGYNLMIGGPKEAVDALQPIFETLGPEGGCAHVGPSGSGHFVKMIHNGIEYALMQAYGEGLEALERYPDAQLDLHQITSLWQNGSVIRSWLLELTSRALSDDPRLERIKGYVQDSGMGRWTVEYGVNHAVPMPAVTAALYARFASRQEDSFAAKVTAALRNEFGGHDVKEID